MFPRRRIISSTGPNLSVLPRVGPFAGHAPVPISGLSNLVVNVNTTIDGGTFLNPAKYNTVTVASAKFLSIKTTDQGLFLWCNTLNLAGGFCRIQSQGIDGEFGDVGGTTGNGGLGSSGGGGGSIFEAEAGNGGTDGNDGQSIDLQGGEGTGNGTAGSYLIDMGGYIGLMTSGGDAGAGGISTSTGAYYSGSGGFGGKAFAGGGGGGSEDLTYLTGSGGGGGGGGRPMIIVCRNLIVLGGSQFYAPGGNGGEGLSGPTYYTGGGGGGGGGIVYVAAKRKFGALLTPNVGGGDGGYGGLKGEATGTAGSDGTAAIYSINHNETALTAQNFSNQWNNS